METINQALNGMPLWFKALTLVGFPVALNILLLAIITGFIPNYMKLNHAVLIDNQQLIIQAIESHRDQTSILRQLCVNSATSTEARNKCNERIRHNQ